MKRWRIKRLDEWPEGPVNWNDDMDVIAGLEITEEEYQKVEERIGYSKNWFQACQCSIFPYHLIEISNDLREGDMVHCSILSSMDGHAFEILEVQSAYTSIHSATWKGGHSCTTVKDRSKITNEKGCWNTQLNKLTKINKNDVPRKNSEGLQGGHEINISSQNIEIASGSRFTGRRATDFECRDAIGSSPLKGRRI